MSGARCHWPKWNNVDNKYIYYLAHKRRPGYLQVPVLLQAHHRAFAREWLGDVQRAGTCDQTLEEPESLGLQ